MSEVYIGLRKRRKRTHPSKCPCCIADQEVEPENEASAGSENTIDVIKENRQIKRKRAIKRKPNETRSESESEQNYSETKSPPTKKSRKLRSSSEESPQQSTTAKKVSKTRCKSNHEKSTKSEKTLTKSKTKKGGVKTKNISNKELKSNNKNTKTSEHDSDEDIKREEGEGQLEDVVTAAKASKNKARSHNNKRKATKSNCGRVKPHPINTKTKQGNSKTEDDDEDDHLTSKSVKVKKTVSKQAVKGKALRRVPVEKPSLAFIKTESKTKGSGLTQVVQLKISVFDDLYSKLKSRNNDISIEEAAEMLSKISSDNLLIAFKTSQKPDKLGSNASRQEKKVISDTEEIVSQAAEALVSFRAKSPISREDPNKSEKINPTQSSFTSTTAPLISQAGEKVKPSVTAAASAVQALMQFQSSSSVPCTFPSTLTSSKVPQNMLHGVLPAVTLSQSFPQLLQPNLTTSFTNLMPMVSSHATLPSFSQIAAHLRPPPPMSGITNTLSSNLPGGMQSPLITPSLSSASVPSTSLMLPNQPLLQPQLQQPLPLTNPVTSCKPNLTAVKNTAPTVETTSNKTTTQKQNPLQQPLKGMEEVVGNVGTNVPQPILWNLKSPVVFLGSPQNLGGVPRNLVASPSTSQSVTSLEQAGYRPVAPKPVSKSDTSHSTAAPVSSVPNLLTLGGRPILPRTQLQGGDDSKKLQTPQSGMPFIPQLPSINPSHPYQAAGSALQPLTQVSAASPKRTTLMSVSLPSSSIITNLSSSSTSVGQTLSPFMQQSMQDNTSVKCTSPSTVSAKQAVKKLVHERTKSAELKKEASGGANPHTTTKLKAILPLPPKDPSTSTVTSTETKSNEFNLEQAATALLSIGVPDGIETIGLKQGSSDPSKDDYEEDVVFTSKGTFRVGDVDVDPRYNRIGREGYTCGKCNKIFTSLSYLARHIKRVCPDMSCRKWKCTLCDKAFRHPFGLQQHVYTHTGERPHKCPLCPKAFYSSNDLRRHSRIHSGERPYRCKHCDKSFATTISLKTHTYIHTGEKPHKCPQCPKTFATSSKLGRHIVTHSEQRPYSCDQCPKSFNRSGDLRRHNLAVHDGKEKSFECEVCPSTFSKSADLRRHNVTVHQKTVKTLQCEDCGTQFTTQLCLKMHRDTYHKKSSSTDSNKIHTCDVCGKTYSNAALLTKHKATHESTAAYNLSQFQHIAPKPSEQLMNEGGTG